MSQRGKDLTMQTSYGFAHKAILCAAFALPAIGNNGVAQHAHAQQAANNPQVIAVYDATLQSDCTYWRGTPANTRSCPPGSVVYTSYMPLKSALAHHRLFVTPSRDSVATRHAVDALVHMLHLSVPQKLTTTIRTEDFTPFGTCADGQIVNTGGSYWGNNPNVAFKVYYNVRYTIGFGRDGNPCPANSIQDQVSTDPRAPTTNWYYSAVAGVTLPL